MNDTDEKVTASYHLTRKHVDVVKEHAETNYDGNASMALRRIIDEWATFKAAQLPLPMTEAK
jgi:hypothetical protein